MSGTLLTPLPAPALPSAAVFYLTEVYNGPHLHAGYLVVRHLPGEKVGTEIGQGYGHWHVLTAIVRPLARPGDVCITTPLGWPERGPRRVFDVVAGGDGLKFVERLPGGAQPAEDETTVVEAETYRMWLESCAADYARQLVSQGAR